MNDVETHLGIWYHIITNKNITEFLKKLQLEQSKRGLAEVGTRVCGTEVAQGRGLEVHTQM